MVRRKTDSTIKILYHQVKPDAYKDGKKVRSGLDCPDGIAAAWVVLRKYPTGTLVGCSYGSEIPAVDDGDLLIIVDFSFELNVLNKWCKQGCEIILIDHHKTLVDKVHEHTMNALKKLLGLYLQTYKRDIYLINTPKQPVLKHFLEFAKLTNFWQDIKSSATWQRHNPRLYEILDTRFIDSEDREFVSWFGYTEANNLNDSVLQNHPYFEGADTLLLSDLSFVILVETYLIKFCQDTSVKQLFKYFSDGDLNFDISKCGAVLTWEYFFPDEPVPAFLAYIQDRDLWQWLQPKSKEINEAFGHIRHGSTRIQILEEMDRFYSMTQDNLIYHFETLGEMLLAPKRERSQLLAKNANWVTAWGYKFLAVQLDSKDAYFYNDVMEILYTENHNSPFVCSYIKQDGTFKLSFRSKQQYNSFDVSKLARSIGGGGHKEAAGAILDTLPW